jgi:PPOX class probable F420-dependent enzyme
MAIPVTEIDSRFSNPGAAATEWDQAQAVLESAQLSWLATVRADGRPHVTPLVAVWLDDALYFSTGAAEQKAVNLRANPQVTLTTGCNSWDAGLDVVVEGTAERVTAAAELERLAAAWREKWDGRWQYEVGDGCFGHEAGGEALVFAVRPAKVLSFAKGSFSQTRHMFCRNGAWLI